MTWLNSIQIAMNDTKICIDYYATDYATILMIESISYQGTTHVIDAWSIGTHRCTHCNRVMNDREYNARDGECQRCWGQIDGDVE